MAKGEKTGGRKKGTPNKVSASLKDAILNAFSQVGGENYLVKVAQENPQTFCQLLGKVLPTQVTGGGENGELEVVGRLVWGKQPAAKS